MCTSIGVAVQAFNIKCNVTSEINHIGDGIRLGLTDDREKHSASLGRTAQWKGNASLTALPAYLTVQIMRFYYKVQAQQRAKIMRKVPLLHCFSTR
jgi:ubiquitin carboxyl-terminal hydrolase 14